MNFDFINAPYQRPDMTATALAEYPHSYFPLLVLGIEGLKDRPDWINLQQQMIGRSDLAKIQVELIMGANINRLIASSEATYRLLNATFNGQAYTSTANASEPSGFLTTPAIPQSPAAYNQATAAAALALRSLVAEQRSQHAEAYTEQLGQGVTLDTVVIELSEIKALLAALDAEQTAEDLTEIITRLGAILALL